MSKILLENIVNRKKLDYLFKSSKRYLKNKLCKSNLNCKKYIIIMLNNKNK
jgi:hypothetical protein